MSLCDTCPVPGHCCRTIVLSGGVYPEAETIAEAEEVLRSGINGDRVVAGPPMPFRPLFKTSLGHWVLWCPRLDQKTGRCLDYVNRPMCCSDYEPASDPLCVLHEAAE